MRSTAAAGSGCWGCSSGDWRPAESRGATESRAPPAAWRTVTRSLTFTRLVKWAAMCSKEVLSELEESLSSSNARVASAALDAVGVIYEEYDTYRGG